MRFSSLPCAILTLILVIGCNNTTPTELAPIAGDRADGIKHDRTSHLAAAPVTVLDQNGTAVFEMQELSLTILDVRLKGEAGDVMLPLPNPVSIDILTLDNTSALFALGTFPAGQYEEVEFAIASAVMVGDDLTSGVPVPKEVELEVGKSAVFEVEFLPPLEITPISTPVILDFRETVKATSVTDSGGVEYELEDSIRGFVIGN